MWQIFFLLFPLVVCAQVVPPKPACSAEYFHYVISALANDSMEGRMAGTIGEKMAAEFIAGEFARIGCQPVGRTAFFHPFVFLDPDSVERKSYGNVISRIDSKGEKCIVIGAHYDHLGMGKHHSRSPFTRAIHNGADDNASGVAMMLGLAAWYCNKADELEYDLILLAFAAEEDGLFGSEHFLSNSVIDTSLIKTYLNFDMLGRLNALNPLLKIEGLVEYPEFNALLLSDSLAGFSTRRSDPIFVDGSDNYSFVTKRIPGLSFSTGIHEHYHTPDDDIARINFEGMEMISRYLQVIVNRIQATTFYDQ